MIKAEVHSDDHNIEVEFDATPWFDYASEKQIIELARCDWGGDYPADAVAQFCSNHDPRIQKLFDYLDINQDDSSKKDCGGFECHVDKVSARVWIRANYPKLMGSRKG